jgi:hypothetical protein
MEEVVFYYLLAFATSFPLQCLKKDTPLQNSTSTQMNSCGYQLVNTLSRKDGSLPVGVRDIFQGYLPHPEPSAI